MHPVVTPYDYFFVDFSCCLNINTVESVLLYGCETWTITTQIRKGLDGCYTRMLRAALNVNWKTHMTNNELYGDIPQITTK